MNAIRGFVKNGRISLDAPPEWPEGCPILVEPITTPIEKIGIDESEWRDDLASLRDWEAWIKTIELLEFTQDEQTAFARFNEAMRQYNVEAVRRQMEEGPLP